MQLGRALLALSFVAATLLILGTGVACTRQEEGKVKVRVALDWFPNANHAGIFLAREKGYFADEGLDVTLYTPDDPSTILATVGAGQDDFGFEYEIGVLLARDKGVPVVSIAGLVQHPLNSVMALKASGIQRPRDLVGKKVGYPGIATNPPILDTMLKADGARGLQDVELVNVGYDLVPALISKRVDAIVGAYWTSEAISAENQGYPVNVLRMEKWGVPDFYELVLVASERKLKEQPDVVQRFVRALARGYQEAARDPQKAIDVLKKAAPEVDEKIDRPGADLLAPLWTEGIPTFGWQTAEKWHSFATWMKEHGLVGQGLNPDGAFTNRFVEAAK